MKPLTSALVLALALLPGMQPVSRAQTGAPPPAEAGEAAKWPAEPKWAGPGPMPRHYMVALWGVPATYQGMTNPLQRRPAALDRGKAIYRQYCAACHGDDGAGDGPAGRALKPPPGNLVWLSDVPEKEWDAFMYWTIAEGGTALGTSMPPYRQLLSREDIWAVTAYIQDNIPFVSRMR